MCCWRLRKGAREGLGLELRCGEWGLCEAVASGGCGNCEGAADAIVVSMAIGVWEIGAKREEESSEGASAGEGGSDGKRVRAVVGEVATVLLVVLFCGV